MGLNLGFPIRLWFGPNKIDPKSKSHPDGKPSFRNGYQYGSSMIPTRKTFAPRVTNGPNSQGWLWPEFWKAGPHPALKMRPLHVISDNACICELKSGRILHILSSSHSFIFYRHFSSPLLDYLIFIILIMIVGLSISNTQSEGLIICYRFSLTYKSIHGWVLTSQGL